MAPGPFIGHAPAFFRASIELRKNRKNRKTHLMEGAQNDPMRDVEAANIVEMSSPMGDIRNEAQARELAPLVKEAWDQLVSKTYPMDASETNPMQGKGATP